MTALNEKKEIIQSIRQTMYHALEKHLQCQVYSTGMYKGINGYVESIHNGTVVIAGETEEGTPVKHVFRLSDIKRVSVFDR